MGGAVLAGVDCITARERDEENTGHKPDKGHKRSIPTLYFHVLYLRSNPFVMPQTIDSDFGFSCVIVYHFIDVAHSIGLRDCGLDVWARSH